MGIRQVSFLGLGPYEITRYQIDGIEVETRFVAEAIARALSPVEIQLVGTESAWERHGAALTEALVAAGCPRPDWVPIPDGMTEAEQWTLFERLLASLRRSEIVDRLVLDVTHGWRAQPFVAAAVLTYHRATEPDALPMRVLYGAFTRGAPVAPLWDLTAFLEVVDWGRGLGTLLQTGRASAVVTAAEQVARERSKEWATAGQDGPPPRLNQLVTALRAFSADLATVRTGELVGPDGTAARLLSAVEASQEEVRQALPPLFPMLGRVSELARPLTLGRLGGEGEEALLAALARLYLSLDRLLEAITVVREARVSRFAEPAARAPGTARRPIDAAAFQRGRAEAEARWREQDAGARALSEIRNTLDHAAFQGQPPPARTVAEQVRRQVEALGAHEAPSEAPERPEPIFLNLSNHPHAGWEPAQRQAALQLAPRLEDLPFPEVPPELDDVSEIAQQVLAQIPEGTTHAMVQGESVLTAMLVSSLQRRGVVCLAATSWRQVEEVEGRRISTFRFSRFRVYPG